MASPTERRAGEGDEVHVGTADQFGADLFADARQVIDDAVGNADVLQDFHQAVAHDRRLLGRLHHDRVAGRQSGGRHAGEDRQREIPGGNDGGDAARAVGVDVLFAGPVGAVSLDQLADLVGVIHAEIDRFRHVGIGLGPRLAALVDFPGGQLETVIPHFGGGQLEVFGTVPRLGAGPLFEGPPGRLDGHGGLFGSGRGDAAHHLRFVRGTSGGDRVPALDGPSVDHQRIFLAELGGHFGDGPLHVATRLGPAEVGRRLVA